MSGIGGCSECDLRVLPGGQVDLVAGHLWAGIGRVNCDYGVGVARRGLSS